MNEPTLEQIKEIILAEKAYWDKAPFEIAIGASGACCNILAALYGLRAPWHPQLPSILDKIRNACPTIPDHGREL